MTPCDILLVVADDDIGVGIRNLLEHRHIALGIRELTVDVFNMQYHDPECFAKSHEVIRERKGAFRKFLILFDHEGSGQEGLPVDEVEEDVRKRLRHVGCADCADVVVFEPEFDIVAWSDSAEVDRALGWQGRETPLREWLVAEGWIEGDEPKPRRPKEALQAALRETRTPWSASVFAQLARNVGVERCTDASFGRLKDILRRWFTP